MEKMNTNIRPENAGVYELNCKIAEALNLPHKQELDKKERASGDWDQRSVHIRVHYKDRLKPYDFTRNIPLLIAYAACYGIDLINSGEKPKSIATYKNGDSEIELKEFVEETVSEVLIKAILAHCEMLKPTEPQFLVYDYKSML
ncbi:hypothetical protein FORC53_4619 [Vibrio vulnificus]|uniref:Uncharacterized protein n=2 Tax=Vibrio vulnificus TaxID=672 RepID=A0AAN1PU23_VIBVL|nr:hypothetical protein FORC53_4619 [Vibrio vulnificus]